MSHAYPRWTNWIQCSLSTLSFIHRYSMDKLLRGIQKTTSTEDAEHIISEFTSIDDILASANRCPKVSSVGRDGLPYPILQLILAHADCNDLVTNIYGRDALILVFSLLLGNKRASFSFPKKETYVIWLIGVLYLWSIPTVKSLPEY